MTRCLFLLTLLVLLGGRAWTAETLTASEKQEALAQLQIYKQTPDARAREEAVEKVVLMARPAREGMLKVVDADALKAAADYRAAFSAAAAKVRTARDSKDARNEIKTLRATVLGLSARGGGLSKEDIVKEGDPALARLKELLGPSSLEAVTKAQPSLTVMRERTVSLLKCRESLRAALGVSDGKQFPPEKLGQEESEVANLPAIIDKDALKILEANKKLETQIDPAEAEGIRDLNNLRILLGLPPLTIDVKLCEASRGHSKDMVDLKFFDHTSPVSGKASPWDRAKLAGTSAHAENIAAGNATGPDANQAWWHSPGHHINMLGGHRRIGLGKHNQHWTQMFGG